MRLFLSKKSWVAILSGIVFLLGGVQVAFGAQYFFNYNVIGDAVVSVSGPYPDMPSCQAGQQTQRAITDFWGKPNFNVGSCNLQASAAASASATTQTQANATQQVVAQNAVANAGGGSGDAYYDSLKCGSDWFQYV